MHGSAAAPHVQISADDDHLVPFAGLLLPGELIRRTGLVDRVDTAVDAVKAFKQRKRGHTAGELVVALAETMLAGGDHLAHLKVLRQDEAGASLRASTAIPHPRTAGELLCRFTVGQCRAVVRTVATVGNLVDRDLGLDHTAPVTFDIDTTPTEVYGRKKEEATRNRKGELGYLSHFVTWAERHRILAAELFPGSASAKPSATRLLAQALAALPAGHGPVSARADSEYFCLDILEYCRSNRVRFAISVPRNSAMWRASFGIKPEAWQPARDMHGAEVAVTTYKPDGWKHEPLRLVIRRVRTTVASLSSSPLARRRRTIPKLQLALALQGSVDEVDSYSFILTDVAGDPVDVEYWQRQRTDIEERNKDTKLGCGLLHLPLGTMRANRAWQAATITAVNLAQMLCAVMIAVEPTTEFDRTVDDGHDEPTHRLVRTLRRWMIAVPGRLARRGRTLHLHLPRGWLWASRITAVYERLRLIRT
jgi:Transposase DDE domain group 1